MQMRVRMVVALAFVAVYLSGCAIGPNWKQPMEFTKGNVNVQGKTVVVSDFKFSEQKVSYTSSGSIQSILESAYVQDYSLIMATKLAESGVKTVAREGVKANQLKNNEILMRGAIIAHPLTKSGADVMSEATHYIVWGCSLLTIGGILPSPFPLVYGVDFSYRTEFVDSSGDILYQSGDRKNSVSYSSFYIWGLMSYADEYRQKLITDMPNVVVNSLRKDVLR